MLAPPSVGQITLGQHEVALLPQLILKDTTRGLSGLTTMSLQQQPQSRMPFQAYAHYAMGPPQSSFSFRCESSNNFLCHVLVSHAVWILLSASHVGAQPLGFATPQLVGVYPWQTYVSPCNGLWYMPGVHQLAAPPTAFSRGSFMLLIQQFTTHSSSMRHTALGAWQSHLIPPHSLHGREGSSCPGTAPLDDAINSASFGC